MVFLWCTILCISTCDLVVLLTNHLKHFCFGENDSNIDYNLPVTYQRIGKKKILQRESLIIKKKELNSVCGCKQNLFNFIRPLDNCNKPNALLRVVGISTIPDRSVPSNMILLKRWDYLFVKIHEKWGKKVKITSHFFMCYLHLLHELVHSSSMYL